MTELPDLNIGWGSVFVSVLLLLGFWLERIGHNRDLLDEFFKPIPLGLVGCLMLVERTFV
jgi:hypothetical protein